MALAGIILCESFFEEVVQIRLEGLEPCMALEGFVEAEKREDDVSTGFLQPIVRRAEVCRAMADDDFVTGPGEIAEDEIVIGVTLVNVCLKPAGMLETVGERVADDGDVVAGLEFKLRRILCVSESRAKEHQREGQSFRVHA